MLLQIHWFSIINSCVTVLLLTGFLATILMRVLRKDFVKYTRDDEGELHLSTSGSLYAVGCKVTNSSFRQLHCCIHLCLVA